MATGKNITIRFVATGADSAAKEVDNLKKSTDDLRESEQKRVEVQQQSDTASDVRQIKSLAVAQALNLAAGAAEEMGDKIRNAADDFREFDTEAAARLDSVASGFSVVGDSARGAAAGMALMGPAGAAIGAIVAPAVGKLREEIMGAYQAFLNLKQIEQIADNLPEKMEQVRRNLLVREQVASWSTLVEKIERANAAADSASRIQAALRSANEQLAENQLTRATLSGNEDDAENARAALDLLRAKNAQAEQAEKSAAAERAVQEANTDMLGALKAHQLAKIAAATGDEDAAREVARLRDAMTGYRDKLEAATRNLQEVVTVGRIDRDVAEDTRATDAAVEISRVGEEVTRAAVDAISRIQNNAADEGRAPNTLEQETINRIQGLVNDTTPDAQQGGQLAGILQTLRNNLTQRDDALQSSIESMIQGVEGLVSRYEAINTRIDELNRRINETR